MVKLKQILVGLVFVLFLISCVKADDVEVTVRGLTSIATTDENFICATLDWWPHTKCDYGQCPWNQSGVLNLDLGNKILANAMQAFGNLRIRVGGSLEDQVVYKVGNYIKKFPHFKRRDGDDYLFGFTRGTLPMERWDQLNAFFNQTGVKLTFSLNALIGKKKANDGTINWVGKWDSNNARDLIKYTISKGYNIDSYELGNELCGSGVSARVDPVDYGRDIVVLRKLVNQLYPDPNTRPAVLGPGGFYDQRWFDTFLMTIGPNVVDGVTHHIYNLGAGVDKTLIDKIQDPYFLDQVAQTFKNVRNSVRQFGPWSGAWVGESGGAYNSGGKDVSHTFADGFWYLDQLGMTSTYNHKVYCRQAFVGGNYALLNTTTFIPNPDYYGALLWHRLMGKQVLATSHNASPYLRAYTHCSKTKPGVTLLLINMSNKTSYSVSLVNDDNFYPSNSPNQYTSSGFEQREEYHLTPKDANIQSDVMLLNGTPLQLTQSLDIPEMQPRLVDPSSPITVAPHSFVFVTIKDFKAPACV
ncbi:heparanase-like protein 2 isoform X2 [Mercurialis annua]|uniref:heparanase-like protein 2 isoform X2 n=1 Tax=Mercurialis annua TaxID=3986 RepID=UPI002161022C|nr:heparanase-like protein 2 isoform X2 [Mercurialis annua]